MKTFKFLFCFQNTWTKTQINGQRTPVQLLILGKLLQNQEVNQALENQIIQISGSMYVVYSTLSHLVTKSVCCNL